MRGEHTETVKEHYEDIQTVEGQEPLAAEDIRLDLPSAYWSSSSVLQAVSIIAD